MYYDLQSFPSRYRDESKALEFLKKAVGVASGVAEAVGGIARALKVGDASGIVNATKGGIRALASALPSPREREHLSVWHYMEVAAATARGRVEALKPEYAVLVFDNVESGKAIFVTEMANRIASGLYSEFGVKAVAFVVTTPLGMKRVAYADLSDSGHVYYAVIENPTREDFALLFYDLGGHRILKYGYTADDLYSLTGGNLEAAKHVVEHADHKSLCGEACVKMFARRARIYNVLRELQKKGLFNEVKAYVSGEKGALSREAVDLFMDAGLVYYRPHDLAAYKKLALPYRRGYGSEYAWSSRLAKYAVAAAAADVENAYKARVVASV